MLFQISLQNVGSTLEIGRQEDITSCGICVVNSIEHHIFGTPLFTHGERDALRVYYFTKTVEFLVNGVSAMFLDKRMTLTLMLSQPTPEAGADDTVAPAENMALDSALGEGGQGVVEMDTGPDGLPIGVPNT